ncbi:hypothetical protein HCN44_004992 [Aphidius gifuensis]|uniref:UDP-glucuronosyltransferase n=1 Tax=Aphidius gifuensis TaxID=684658 RepID=A0A834XUB6_APHGI|nr:hypothetical protein HCN44_004992 [Aphidius gifuensis]
MNLVKVIVLILMSSFVNINNGYRILGIFPSRPRSHHIMFDAICKELANRGHHVDVMTMYPNKNPPKNYNVIANFEKYDESVVNKFNISFAMKIDGIVLRRISEYHGNRICEYLGLPEIQKIVKNPPTNPAYDLVIVESFGANCFIGIGHVLKVPVIMASSTLDLPWLDNALGQPANTAFFPSFFTINIHPMSFFTRLFNTLNYHINLIGYQQLTKAIQNSQMKKYLDDNIPPLEELEKNVVLALVNSFHSLNGIRPITPSIIEVGGLHVNSNFVPLPKVSHKNTKVFITHGGLMGTQEALTYGIPLIGIPLFGDQPANIIYYSKLNMSLHLDINNLTEDTISHALNEILNNPKYKNAAVFQSARFLDRPMSPIDTAIYWTEYAIRNGQNSLRSPVVDMSWWQVNLLDVYLFIIILFLIILFTIIFLFNMAWRIVLSTRKHDKND